MAELLASGPLDGLGPVTAGGVTLKVPPQPDPITWIAPLAGQEGPVDAALRAAGLGGFPAPGQVLAAGGAQIVWAGRAQALVMGAPAPDGLEPLAACVDHADAWCMIALEGARASEVLARLVPIDLRPAAFGPGMAARSLLGHVQALFLRAPAPGGDEGAAAPDRAAAARPGPILILLPRSLARSGWDDIARSLTLWAARPDVATGG